MDAVPPPHWRTFRPERTVLAVVHNLTALTRLLDVLPVLAEDPRLQVAFTTPGSSAFHTGTVEALVDRGTRVLDWADAVSAEVDLAISASYGGDLHDLAAPLLTVPHGMGYNIFQEIGNRKSEIGNRKSEIGFRAFAGMVDSSGPARSNTHRAVPRRTGRPARRGLSGSRPGRRRRR